MNETYLIIVVLVVIIIAEIYRIISKKKKKLDSANIDEFDNINEEDKKKKNAEEQLKFDSDVVNAVSYDAFNNSLNESAERAPNPNSYKPDSLDYSHAFAASRKAEEQAKRDMYNFRIIDSVEVEKEGFKEGSKISLLQEHGYNIDINTFKKWCIQLFRFIKLGAPDQFDFAKSYMTDSLSQKYESQSSNFAKDGIEFVTEDLIVENCYIYEFTHGVSKDELQILIEASMKEYIFNKTTGEILRGDKNNSINKKIIMTFEKIASTRTEGILSNCPLCGSPLTQTDFEKCHSCQKSIIPINYNWVLTKFETL